MEVEAFGIGGAMDMACDRWPDEGAWWGEVVE